MTTALDTAEQVEELLTERKGAVLILRLNRPSVLNALRYSLVSKIVAALEKADRDPEIRVSLLTGGDKAFAAGADIKEMADADFMDMLNDDPLAQWQRLRKIQKPVVAAVAGFALGGGLELAMSCDLIVAAEDAEFGQPEIKLGLIPGAGGTQRLARAIGARRALEYILTGARFSAKQALEWGLVNRVVSPELLQEEALRLACEIASRAPIAARLAKEAVGKALDVDLDAGLDLEKKLFYSLFATEDAREGMKAFMEKRKPDFKGK